MKENPAATEQNTPTPTTLHLFSYKGPEFEALKIRASQVRMVGENFTKTDESLVLLSAESKTRGARLSQIAMELLEQSNNIDSSITCGMAFLRLRDELPELSPQNFIDIFKQFLISNTNMSEQVSATIRSVGNEKMVFGSLSTGRSRQAQYEIKDAFDKTISNPPNWFKRNKDEWRLFVYTHANFFTLLNPDLLKKRLDNPRGALKHVQQSADLLGYTKKGEFPDWLQKDSQIMPEKEDVERELEEDKEQMQKTREALDRIKKQGKYLSDTVHQKIKKATARISDLTTQVFPDSLNFSDMILYLQLTGKKLSFLPINEDAAERVIQDYVESITLMSDQEPLALYLEKKLVEGGIIKTSQDPMDDNFINLATSALRHIKAQRNNDGQENSFQNLKTTDKKAYGVLNYDIRPFLEVIPDDELSLLEDLLKESKDKPVELFIWDMAKSISSAFKNKKREDLTKSQAGAVFYLSKFTTSFLKAHAAWAFDQIQESLVGEDQETSFETDEQPTSEIQQEIETATEEIAQGNLAGWQFFYTTNRTSESRHLIEIENQTTEDFERNVHRFITDRKISCSIPASSIVNAFEWLLTEVPEEVEQTRMGMQINGEYFKKLKRERVRILYQKHPSKKELIFFLHQKQAWGYGF